MAVAAAVVASAETALGIAWRPELSWAIENRSHLKFIELLVENLPTNNTLPEAVKKLQKQGVRIALHGVSLSLGSAERPNPNRLKRLAESAQACNAHIVSEHLAFVRGGGIEAGHLLPLHRRSDAMKKTVENIQITQAALPVPLAVENIASLFRYPDDALTEAEYLREILVSANCLLLLDVANLYANSVNYGFDPVRVLDELPLDRLAYVHIAGGILRDGFYHDTHAHPTGEAPLMLLSELCKRVAPPAVILERDEAFPGEEELDAELQAIQAAIAAPLVSASTRSPAVAENPPGRAKSSEETAPDDGAYQILEVQESLIRCMSNGASAPAGFDALELERSASTLFHKRMRVMVRCHPSLPDACGDNFHISFRSYANKYRLNSEADGGIDGYGFALYSLLKKNTHHIAIAKYVLLRVFRGPEQARRLFQAMACFHHSRIA